MEVVRCAPEFVRRNPEVVGHGPVVIRRICGVLAGAVN
jgi:hypothetical protein